MNGQPVILKLGGSLLTFPQLLDHVMQTVSALRPAPVLIIVGGGTEAELIRQLDQQFGLSAEKAHWDAIAAMTCNAEQLTRLQASLKMVTNRDQAAKVWAADAVAVLDAFTFLQQEQPAGRSDVLPASWDVTSDSISLWVANHWPAQRLILAKSCDPASLQTDELLKCGSIDPWFTHVRGECPIDWVNLKRDPVKFVRLHHTFR